MAAIVTQGKTAIRDALKTLITHVGVSTASDAFAVGQTAIDPTPGTNLIKTSTEADVDASSFDATMSINGDSEFTGLIIRTISILDGSLRTDILSRSVRSAGIGVQAGDAFTVGVRVAVEDNSA